MNFKRLVMFKSLIGCTQRSVITKEANPFKLFHRFFSDSNAVINVNKTKKFRQETPDVIKWILLGIPVTSFGLGTWQVYRLKWKLGLIDLLKEKSTMTPRSIPQDFSELNSLEYAPVKVTGEFLHDKEILIGPRALIEQESKNARAGSLISNPKKNQGWLVITPFKLSESGDIILINRGWIPQSLRPPEKRISSFVQGEIELVGLVRFTEKRAPFMPKNQPERGQWSYRDLEEISSYLDCAPVWLDARGITDPPEGWPLPNQTRVTLRNEHVSYVFTWYSLSVFTAIMWHRYFIRKIPLL